MPKKSRPRQVAQQVAVEIPNPPGWVAPKSREEYAAWRKELHAKIGGTPWSHPDPVILQQDFVVLGTPYVERGFWVTPVNPQTKKGCLRNLHAANSLAELEKLASGQGGKYKYHIIGVVFRRGEGRNMVLDIDAPGVLERITAYGKARHCVLPETFTVLSRPLTKPYKKHLHYVQTAYSIKKFAAYFRTLDKNSVNINIKDLNVRDEDGDYLNLLDVIGIGGPGFVVGAGSARATVPGEPQEYYTVVNWDTLVALLPDFLVDWIIEQHKTYVAAKEKLRAEKRAIKLAEREKYTFAQRVAMRKEGLPAGFDVFAEDTFQFMRSRTGSLSSLGFEPDQIEQCVIWQVEKFCVDGVAFVNSDKGRATLYKVTHATDLIRGDASYIYAEKEKRQDKHLDKYLDMDEADTDSIIVRGPHGVSDRTTAMIAIIKDFPNKIAISVAYDLLAKKLAGRFTFDRSNPRDQQQVKRARDAAGFKIEGKFWVKVK